MLMLFALMSLRDENARSIGMLVGVLAGAAFLTRYAGLVLLPTALIGIFLLLTYR